MKGAFAPQGSTPEFDRTRSAAFLCHNKCVMLIVALILAFVLYAGLILFYESAAPHLNAPPPLIIRMRDVVFSAPESLPLALLKWGLIIFAFYVVGDAIVVYVKRTRGK